ncbi:50S ribosomal protein L28 [Candidatus Cerribacteria bacterium 'Amazon FNV 2010 28 9']|uniref:Large ribosomal subunit protein bL28 n=1 Tax=Candidatus Cerribacteria bacterium 'Amazon FNV 2010 28 9' TaxID=2081795 RepID=A0A317JNB0_9BACT|nr:MAG: 50S ribosomal protein L28 [Candidatus Cerribacteria bacterium 'Amazon FNV 2010 28 9']
MATSCFNCGKTAGNGNIVSHAKNRTKHIRKPNLHTAHILIDGAKKKVSLCTKCIRAAVRPHQVNA